MAMTPRSKDVFECFKSKDFSTLKSIGMNQGFGSNNTIRLRCYSILLGCNVDVYDEDGKGKNDKFDYFNNSINTKKTNYSELINRDSGRHGYLRWNITQKYSEFQRNYDLLRIKQLLNVVFGEHQEFNYMQSFDSVFALIYLISNGNLYIAKKIVVSYLHIFRSDLSLSCNGFGHLTSKNGLWRLLKKYDNHFCKWLKSMTLGGEEDVSFVMEWYTSWFAHSSIQNFNLILRIYDFMIATQNQQIGLFMVITVLLCKKNELIQYVKDSGDLIYFVKNKLQFDAIFVDKMFIKCTEIIENENKCIEFRNSWQFKTWKEIKKNCKAFGIYL
eukprot:70043_1